MIRAKKSTAIILSAIMAASYMPAIAYADTTTPTTQEQSTKTEENKVTVTAVKAKYTNDKAKTETIQGNHKDGTAETTDKIDLKDKVTGTNASNNKAATLTIDFSNKANDFNASKSITIGKKTFNIKVGETGKTSADTITIAQNAETAAIATAVAAALNKVTTKSAVFDNITMTAEDPSDDFTKAQAKTTAEDSKVIITTGSKASEPDVATNWETNTPTVNLTKVTAATSATMTYTSNQLKSLLKTGSDLDGKKLTVNGTKVTFKKNNDNEEYSFPTEGDNNTVTLGAKKTLTVENLADLINQVLKKTDNNIKVEAKANSNKNKKISLVLTAKATGAEAKIPEDFLKLADKPTKAVKEAGTITIDFTSLTDEDVTTLVGGNIKIGKATFKIAQGEADEISVKDDTITLKKDAKKADLLDGIVTAIKTKTTANDILEGMTVAAESASGWNQISVAKGTEDGNSNKIIFTTGVADSGVTSPANAWTNEILKVTLTPKADGPSPDTDLEKAKQAWEDAKSKITGLDNTTEGSTFNIDETEYLIVADKTTADKVEKNKHFATVSQATAIKDALKDPTENSNKEAYDNAVKALNAAITAVKDQVGTLDKDADTEARKKEIAEVVEKLNAIPEAENITNKDNSLSDAKEKVKAAKDALDKLDPKLTDKEKEVKETKEALEKLSAAEAKINELEAEAEANKKRAEAIKKVIEKLNAIPEANKITNEDNSLSDAKEKVKAANDALNKLNPKLTDKEKEVKETKEALEKLSAAEAKINELEAEADIKDDQRQEKEFKEKKDFLSKHFTMSIAGYDEFENADDNVRTAAEAGAKAIKSDAIKTEDDLQAAVEKAKSDVKNAVAKAREAKAEEAKKEAEEKIKKQEEQIKKLEKEKITALEDAAKAKAEAEKAKAEAEATKNALEVKLNNEKELLAKKIAQLKAVSKKLSEILDSLGNTESSPQLTSLMAENPITQVMPLADKGTDGEAVTEDTVESLTTEITKTKDSINEKIKPNGEDGETLNAEQQKIMTSADSIIEEAKTVKEQVKNTTTELTKAESTVKEKTDAATKAEAALTNAKNDLLTGKTEDEKKALNDAVNGIIENAENGGESVIKNGGSDNGGEVVNPSIPDTTPDVKPDVKPDKPDVKPDKPDVKPDVKPDKPAQIYDSFVDNKSVIGYFEITKKETKAVTKLRTDDIKTLINKAEKKQVVVIQAGSHKQNTNFVISKSAMNQLKNLKRVKFSTDSINIELSKADLNKLYENSIRRIVIRKNDKYYKIAFIDNNGKSIKGISPIVRIDLSKKKKVEIKGKTKKTKFSKKYGVLKFTLSNSQKFKLK